MHVAPLSYKIGACQIFVQNFSAKNKQIFEFGLVQPGPNNYVADEKRTNILTYSFVTVQYNIV